MIGDPQTAPPRGDLTFLRRRAKPKPPPALTDFITGHATAHNHDHPAPAAPTVPTAQPPAPPISFARPSSSSGSLDLSAPVTPAPPTPSAPAPPPVASAPPPSSVLDLSDPGPRAAVAASRPAPKVGLPVHRDTRISAGRQQLLDVRVPTVTLTRVQSGIGQLTIEAVCSPDIGDLRLGAAYQLRGGVSSTVQYAGGQRFAPSSKRPVIVAGRDEYEHLRLDLRQVPSLERLAVYAFSESRAQLRWGGTLVVTTYGNARIELPLETLFAGTTAVLMSIYNLEGELVIRAEMETIVGDVRDAARAYGYDRITWRDDRTPVDA
jgi:uncharacterized protein involved in tellurium resistance